MEELELLERPVVVTDMKKKLKDVLMAISWREFANTYFQRSSSWFYHKMDGIDGNGGKGGFNEEEVEQMRTSGRPTLVGTTSVEISEMLSKMLQMRKIPHQVLNAKLHQKEADIVALAGQSALGNAYIATDGRGFCEKSAAVNYCGITSG